MAYESVDQLQKVLTKNVFSYAKDPKKAAGRALGTIVEIITFYLLKSWGLDGSIAIERRIPEFGNPDITHNVEYSLHPVLAEFSIRVRNDGKSLTANRLLQELSKYGDFGEFKKLNNNLLSRDGVLRNACTIGSGRDSSLVASIIEKGEDYFLISITQQALHPYAIVECKRVGVEEGNKKGPQTIEKAKQGAYVARTVSSLQKVRLETGDLYGVIYLDGRVAHSAPFHELLEFVVDSDDPSLLRDFVMTIGVVSNHGNWFTAEDHNKELKVLAQSYDWLIFLTDQGVTEFIEEVIIAPVSEYRAIRDAFMTSYAPNKRKNQFTKVQINVEANDQLLRYFSENADRIENWFNVIAPAEGSLERLRNEIRILRQKNWKEVLL